MGEVCSDDSCLCGVSRYVSVVGRINFILMALFSSEELGMNRNTTGVGRAVLLEIPESKRTRLVNRVRERLRLMAAEAKVCRWMLEVDRLTINGNVVWDVKRRTRRNRSRRRKVR